MVNLLEWSQLQTGMKSFIPVWIDLSALINENIELYSSTASQKAISVEIDISSGMKLYADYNMINTVIRNLLSNAIKYSKKNNKIKIRSIQTEQGTIISIQDFGVGIRAEDIDKIFRIDEHYSTPGTIDESGSGLGLILCKDFIDMHKGKIWVESQLGKGSIFYFLIPNINSK